MKICSALIGLLIFIFSTYLNAQSPLTWVSGTGDDANPGTRTAPGKTFAGMISKTEIGGQISALDPGSFGAVTILHAITIDGTSIPAEITAASPMVPAITVTAGATDVVILRHITINGNNLAAVAIQFNSGKQLIIEDCHIAGFISTGININPSSGGNVVIRNTSISHVPTGVSVNGSGSVNVSLCDVSIQDTTLAAIDALVGKVDIANSLITQNSGIGVKGEGTSKVSCTNTLFASNQTAIQSNTGATVRISNNDFYDNDTTLDNAGGVIATANNNRETESMAPGFPTTSILFQ